MRAERELERLPTVDRAVEFLSLGAVLREPAGVMYGNLVARCRRRAAAGLGVGVFQSIRHFCHLAGCRDRPPKRHNSGADGERHGGTRETMQYHHLTLLITKLPEFRCNRGAGPASI